MDVSVSQVCWEDVVVMGCAVMTYWFTTADGKEETTQYNAPQVINGDSNDNNTKKYPCVTGT